MPFGGRGSARGGPGGVFGLSTGPLAGRRYIPVNRLEVWVRGALSTGCTRGALCQPVRLRPTAGRPSPRGTPCGGIRVACSGLQGPLLGVPPLEPSMVNRSGRRAGAPKGVVSQPVNDVYIPPPSPTAYHLTAIVQAINQHRSRGTDPRQPVHPPEAI